MRAHFGPRVDRLVDYREYPILFVDDEPENRRVFALTFRREFQIRTASSGEDALQSLRDHPAALVVSDHRMAGMSGVELLARVREIDARTLRILVTAYADEETLKDAINEGWIYRYLAKPWRPDEMRLALRNGIEVHALSREREELLREMEALNRTSRLLSRELELIPLLDLVLGMVTEDFGFGGATVFLFDADRTRLQAVRSAPREEAGGTVRLSDLDIPVTTGQIFIDRLREGRTQMLRIADSRRLEIPVCRLATEVAADEMLVLPLVGRAGVIGALMVDNRHGGENFGAADYTLLEGLTHQAVIAIENARFVSDLMRAREQSGRPDRLDTLRTLAAGLAQEIDDPLVAIRTFLSLAPAKRREEDHEFWVSDHDVAMREIDRIRALLRMMGGFDRDAGNGASRTTCDLHEIVTDVVTLLSARATREGVDVEIQGGTGVPKIAGVRDQLQQVALQLLRNAIDAAGRPAEPNRPDPPRGRVVVRLRATSVDGSDAACLEIVDDGCGIRHEHCDRIFDPFFTTRDPDRGIGLGLMICHGIVQEHDGTIEVESLEGRGASFRVILPTEARRS